MYLCYNDISIYCSLQFRSIGDKTSLEVIRDIAVGDEIVLSYGEDFFGPGVCECSTCEEYVILDSNYSLSFFFVCLFFCLQYLTFFLPRLALFLTVFFIPPSPPNTCFHFTFCSFSKVINSCVTDKRTSFHKTGGRN